MMLENALPRFVIAEYATLFMNNIIGVGHMAIMEYKIDRNNILGGVANFNQSDAIKHCLLTFHWPMSLH